MAKKLEYSRKAVEDLTSIWRYTVKDLVGKAG